MPLIQDRVPRRNSATVVPLGKPTILRERDGWGWLVIRGDHGWLCADRRQALREFDQLVSIERWGLA